MLMHNSFRIGLDNGPEFDRGNRLDLDGLVRLVNGFGGGISLMVICKTRVGRWADAGGYPLV